MLVGNAEPQTFLEDLLLVHPDKRRHQLYVNGIGCAEIDYPLKCLDIFGAAVGVARVIRGLNADEYRIGIACLGVACRYRKKVGVAERHIGIGEIARGCRIAVGSRFTCVFILTVAVNLQIRIRKGAAAEDLQMCERYVHELECVQ